MDQNPTPAPEVPVAEPMQPTASNTSNPIVSEPPKKGGKGLAIAALICGILGLVTCWVPFVGLILTIIGVVLGIIALVKKSSKGMAIAGLVCGGLGLIPAVLFSLVLGSLAAIFGGAINECINNPDSELCSVDYEYDDDDDDSEGETCAENLWGDDCEYGSDEYWEAYCKENPDSIFCDDEDDEDDEDDDYSWVEDYVISMFEAEAGDDFDPSNSLFSSAIDGITEGFTDFIVCANDNGVSIKSADDLNEIVEGDEDELNEKYKLTPTQEANIMKCEQDLEKAMDSLTIQ